MKLHELGLKYRTDKAHSHNFTNWYDDNLKHLVSEKLNFLEVGIEHGFSLKMWAEYFENATIYGADILDKSFLDDNRIKTFKINQENESELKLLPGNLDIIVEDGGHTMLQQQVTFKVLFDTKLKPGGYWIIEDCHCSFEEKYGFDGSQSIIFTWLYNLINQQQYGAGFFGGNFDIYSKGLNWPANSIESYRTYKSLIVIEKKS